MCLIAFAIGLRPDLPLWLASNRDEFWDRPTRPLDLWQTDTGMTVASGRDERAGGTWLGISQTGRVAMLTNVRGHETPAARSRGDLVNRWLDDDANPCDTDWRRWTDTVNPLDYGGFNLVLGHVTQGHWVWLTNRVPDGHARGTPVALASGWHGLSLAPGLYGLSNASLDTPWPKTVALKNAAAHILESWTPDDDGATSITGTLWSRDMPEPPFVYRPEAQYGTRSSLVVACHAKACAVTVNLHEWTHPTGYALGQEAAYRRLSMAIGQTAP